MSYPGVSFGVFIMMGKLRGSSLTPQKLDFLYLRDAFANFLNLRRKGDKGADFLFALQNLKWFCIAWPYIVSATSNFL